MSAKPLFKRLLACTLLFLVSHLSKAQLVPQFTATPVQGCAPLVVHFTDQTTGGATQWQWNLGNSTVSFLQNPSVTYFNPGTYTVKLVVTNAAGTKDSIIKTQLITVFALPAVSFTATPLSGCFPLPVQFTDNSTAGTGNITSWLWDFGDGNNSTSQNPAHTYTASGNYNVSLLVTNSNGCTKTLTKTNYVTISSGVHAAFTNSTPSGCSAPQTITFQNQSTGTGTLAYEWHFGDGGTSTIFEPSHTYTTPGSYSVQLIVTNTNGCHDTVTHSGIINIGTIHADFTTPATACAGSPINITNTSAPTPVSSAWTFSDGTTSNAANPIKIFTTAGTYNVKLVANFGGCLDSTDKDITILPKPTSAFTGTPLTSCSLPLTVNFANTSTAATYEWSFGDGSTSTDLNPSHTYTAAGTFSVTLISMNANGCSDTLVKAAYVKVQLPIATINNLPQQGCAPFAWTFGSTVNSIEPVATYQWDFGDGTTSTSATPSHIFAAGTYDIQLIITTASGCTDTVTVIGGIKSTVKPVAHFDADPRDACAIMPVNFEDQSTGTVTTWHWDFGDGSSSGGQFPTHAYEDTGYFDITLIVGNNGCFDTLVKPNFIHIKPPIALFNVDFSCTDHYTRTFTDHSIGADQWHWDFGDGTTSTVQSPVHVYAATGSYTVTLTVINNSTGCDYTKTASLNIAEEHAAFTAAQTEICKNTAADFTATSLSAVPAIVSYDWDFGDGATGIANPVSHIYTQSGTYTVRLIITDVNGCKDTLTRNQYIKVNGPTADFAPSVPGSCLMTSISFNDLSTPDAVPHPINLWHWYYGDGVDENLTNGPFSHSYNSAGIYSVALAVTDSYGCRDSIYKNNLLVISKPEALFSSPDTISCPNKPIQFTNTSTGPGLTYHWDFGDGTSSNVMAPLHVYNADGHYTISLTVVDQYNCTSTLVKPEFVKIDYPVANFDVSDSVSTCPPLIVQFTNTSLHMDTFSWDFGDGNTSTASNPSHFYNVAGIYYSKLTITSPGGCVSVKTQRIEVKGPSGTFSYTPLTGCSPLSVTFTATTQSASSFIWDFNDGTTIPTNDSVISYTYTIPGVYVPKMILKDLAGCQVAVQGLDTIKVNGVTADFLPDTLTRCNSGIVSFANTSVSNDVITGYMWDFGDGTSSTDFEPSHFYATTGIYYTTLSVNTQSGCNNVKTASVPIRVVKTPQIDFAQSANGCVPLTMNFNGSLLNADTSAISWQWTFSDGTTGTGQTLPPKVFSTAGIFNAQLIAVNSSGCRDTANNSLEAYAIPVINAGADISICQGSGQTITASGGATYTWSPAIGLSCTNCASPVATPDSVREYIVTGNSIHNCVNRDTIKVAVNYPFQMQNSPGDTLCKGQSAVLSASGAVSYAWSPSTGLNTVTGATVTAAPSATTNYTVVGFDGKNCFTDTAHFIVKVYPIPSVTVGLDKTINVGQTITLAPTVSPDVTSAVWSPSYGIVSTTFPNAVVKPSLDMQYKVAVTNAGGCTSSATVNVFVLCNGANVYIPNTFSPNGDGSNDVFYARGTGLFTIKQMRIFNRWGEEVFSGYSVKANDVTKGWDGTFKGQKMSPDVYVYIFDIQCENNTTLTYKGNIALIK